MNASPSSGTAAVLPAAPAAVGTWKSFLWNCPKCGYVGVPKTSKRCGTCHAYFVNNANRDCAARRKQRDAERKTREVAADTSRGLTKTEREEHVPAAISRGILRPDLDRAGAFVIVRLPRSAREGQPFAIHNQGIVPLPVPTDDRPLPEGADLLETVTRRDSEWYAQRGKRDELVARRQRSAMKGGTA